MKRLSLTKMYSEILRSDFYAFSHRAFLEIEPQTDFLTNWHLEVMAYKLEEVRSGSCKRLIINLPPRHLKSHMASVAFPAWLLGHEPSMRILCASYAQELSDKLARDSRTLLNSPFYQAIFSTRISGERYAVNDFETSHGGGRFSTSVNGVVTGRGADIIIVDDPMKAEDAISDARRNSANEWFDGSLRSRLNNQETGAIIIVMQRLHQDDTVGHVTENEEWDVLSFPAIAVDEENYSFNGPYGLRTFHRDIDDVLHPERYSRERLDELRRQQTDFYFQSQFQQFPISREGNDIKREWLRYYTPSEKPTRFHRIVQSWDTANKANELSNYSVCTTWGISGENRYLLGVFRRRLNYPELKRAVIAEAKKHRPQAIVIEDKASGIQLIQEMRTKSLLPLVAFKPPEADKRMRLYEQADLFESGHVYLPRDAAWLNDYIAELTAFPNSKFNDQVDSTTQALAYMRKMPGSWWPSDPKVVENIMALSRTKTRNPRDPFR